MTPLLRTILVTYPLYPTSLVDRLRTVFETVLDFPGVAGNDYSGAKAVLPTAEALAEADVLLTFNLPANLTHFSQTPRLKLLQLVGAGAAQVTNSAYYKSIPADHPLILANSSGIHTPAISEHVLMTTMALYHKLPQTLDICRGERRWAAPNELGGMFIQELRGQTFGILGYGHIGRQVARLAKAFGVHIIACTREGAAKPNGGFILEGTGDDDGSLPEAYFKTGEKESVHAFLARCDVLVNALPSSEATNRFLGKEEFMAMKDTAIVVNIGRGDTMDQEALVEALGADGERTGRTGTLLLGGASLDVTDPEPLPPNHPLFSLPNVIITPHVCWASTQNFYRAIELLEINKARLDAGKGALNALRGKGELD